MTQQSRQFNAKIGAAVLVGLGLLYMILALATGHSAVAESPLELSANTSGLDVWHALALMVRQGDQLAVFDNRPRENYELFHLPGSVHLPGADASRLAAAAENRTSVLLIAIDDAAAIKLTGEMTPINPGISFHYLQGGVQSWYLTLELPVPLFSEQSPPYGYTDALKEVQQWLAEPDRARVDEVQSAIAKLVTIGYQPTQLAADKKPQAGGARKKISGGCG